MTDTKKTAGLCDKARDVCHDKARDERRGGVRGDPRAGRSILIVGVGGQGTLLASRLIGFIAGAKGYDVKVSEVHGMSQRGGSVVTYVKYGPKVASPLIEPGEADAVVAFELLEAVRWLPYLKPGGKVAANTQKIDPMPVITGAARYPEGLEETIRARCPDAAVLDALSIASECGSRRAVNIVLLGAASAFMGFTEDEWLDGIRKVTPPKALESNLLAFRRGASAAENI
ncbi:MAG: indolepyruvate oxidoreductase subunit beta [Clostridiales bacterium]|jgi:indolepyruvate ferredoxin oxidoreductase beta subunit|nr:indolepyruvate oxidoreductase subunit beta [Clostridiales bacterium]